MKILQFLILYYYFKTQHKLWRFLYSDNIYLFNQHRLKL